MKTLKTLDRKDYNPTSEVTTRIASRAIIMNNNKIAMIKCEKHGYYKFPGGGINQGESLTEALMRETREETGLIIKEKTIKPICYIKEIHKCNFYNEAIFEQESYYFKADVYDEISQTSLDDYEEKLGYHLEYVSINSAIKTNKKLLKKGEFSFLKRENNVLEYLKECNAELKLVEPSIEYLEEIKKYRKMFIDNEESMDGTSSLKKYENINEWLNKVNNIKNSETCPSYLVPASVYLCIKNGKKLVGMVDIRHYLNDNLYHYGGNIGYSIKPTERNKGYGTRQLALAIKKWQELKKLGIVNSDKILITCNETNIGSKKIILANGGKYENTIDNEKTKIERYWIKINE